MRGTADWDSVAGAWERRGPQRLWRAHSDAVNGALLVEWLPEGGRRALKTDAFDEAFGSGLAAPLEERFDAVWEVDVAPAVLRAARRRHPGLRVVAADVRRLPFGDATVDVVVSLSTLDHFEEVDSIETALAEIARVVRPGGRVVVTLDNPENPLVAVRNRLPWPWLRRIGLVPYYVGKTLGRRRLRASLERHGFDVRAAAVIQHAPRAPAVALGWGLSRWAGARAARAFLRLTAACERLRRWPTRRWTGYFVAVLAVRR